MSSGQVKSVLGNSLAWRVFSLSLAYGSLVLALFELYRMSSKYWQVYTDAGKPWQAYINVRENEGWIGNLPIDLSDTQWRNFRSKVPLVLVAGLAFALVARMIKLVTPLSTKSPLHPIYLYYIGTGAVALWFLHGYAMIFPIASALITFLIARVARGSVWNPLLTWLFTAFILWTSDWYRGYQFVDLLGNSRGAQYDQQRGILNWATHFNMLMCRLISYNVDYYYFCNSSSSNSNNQAAAAIINTTKNKAYEEHHDRHVHHVRQCRADFALLPFVSYAFYLPLYIGGPLCSYTAFMSYQMDKAQQEFDTLRKYAWYGVRIIFWYLVLEVSLHFCYINAMNEHGFWRPEFVLHQFYGMPLSNNVQCFILAVGQLAFMYCKFLVIWRMFRWIALVDGVNPPENMVRCFANNYTVTDFWRNWHHSLYCWILSYIYKPMGGRGNRTYSVWLIFMFIALWHDLWTRWVAWAFFNCCIFAMEFAAGYLVSKSATLQHLLQHPRYGTWLVSFGGAICLISMIQANLAILHGFSGVVTNTLQVYATGWSSVAFTMGVIAWFMVGVQIMLWVRETPTASSTTTTDNKSV